MAWICGDGGTEKSKTKIGQKEVGGVDMRGWRYRKIPNRTEGSGWGWICGDGGTEKSNQNRTEGSGWRGYAGMEVQKNQTKIGQKEVGGVDMREWRYRIIKPK